jgi:hypothetical protein
MLLEYLPCNEIAGDDEEHVDADVPSRKKRNSGVEKQNQNYGDCSKAIDGSSIMHFHDRKSEKVTGRRGVTAVWPTGVTDVPAGNKLSGPIELNKGIQAQEAVWDRHACLMLGVAVTSRACRTAVGSLRS